MNTVEDWALHYVTTTQLSEKLAPPPVPFTWSTSAVPLRVSAPGRPSELIPTRRSPRTPRPGALVTPVRRAQLVHTFWHHELQAAELMAWALLAFAREDRDFRLGLLRICLDEIRHMGWYAEHLQRLGHGVGDFPVRDWFWERVPRCADALGFVAVMGMGFEAANLEHAPRFAAQFRAAGDEAGALLQERIAEEEIFHVSFATEWFTRWTGGCDFAVWSRSLPPPLSPLTLRGPNCQRSARLAAGMPAAFVDALEAWAP
ncbi:MAG TPA: DUF455 family protein [Polyangiaceae bacterium]|nr:DUF455 family protein [Polyangiaceae bacterium]